VRLRPIGNPWPVPICQAGQSAAGAKSKGRRDGNECVAPAASASASGRVLRQLFGDLSPTFPRLSSSKGREPRRFRGVLRSCGHRGDHSRRRLVVTSGPKPIQFTPGPTVVGQRVDNRRGVLVREPCAPGCARTLVSSWIWARLRPVGDRQMRRPSSLRGMSRYGLALRLKTANPEPKGRQRRGQQQRRRSQAHEGQGPAGFVSDATGDREA